MLRRVLRQLQHFATALVLLLAVAMGVELWLQSTRPMRTSDVSSAAEPVALTALIPSAVMHHQMRPLSAVSGDDECAGFRTNSLGLRGPEPEIPKPAGTWRVVLLGDDNVSGLWLDDDSLLSTRLQIHLSECASRPVEVINAGVPGYSPLLSQIQFERDLSRLDADLIILHFDMSDVTDDAIHRSCLMEEDNRKICPHPRMTGPMQPGSRFFQLLRQSAVANLLLDQAAADEPGAIARSRYEWTRRSPDDIQLQVRHAMNSVEDLLHLSRVHAQPLVISTAPVIWQVIAPDQSGFVSQRYGVRGSSPVTGDLPFQVLESWCREAGLPFFNPVDAFRTFEAPDQLFQPGTPRLSKHGMALYGRELAKYIVQASVAQSEGATQQQ